MLLLLCSRAAWSVSRSKQPNDNNTAPAHCRQDDYLMRSCVAPPTSCSTHHGASGAQRRRRGDTAALQTIVYCTHTQRQGVKDTASGTPAHGWSGPLQLPLLSNRTHTFVHKPPISPRAVNTNSVSVQCIEGLEVDAHSVHSRQGWRCFGVSLGQPAGLSKRFGAAQRERRHTKCTGRKN